MDLDKEMIEFNLDKEIIKFKRKIIQEGPIQDMRKLLSSQEGNHDEVNKISDEWMNDQRLINNNFEKFKELADTIEDDHEKQHFFKFFIEGEYYKKNYNEDFTIDNVYEEFKKTYKDGNLENINITEEDNNSDNEKNLKLIEDYIPTKVISLSRTYANQILEIYNDILKEKNTKFNPTFFSDYSDEIIKYLKDNNNNDYSHKLRKELIALFTLLTKGNTKKKYNKALKDLKKNVTAGKRKTRRNRKSKKGKKSRKARKSRGKSNRRRGRR